MADPIGRIMVRGDVALSPGRGSGKTEATRLERVEGLLTALDLLNDFSKALVWFPERKRRETTHHESDKRGRNVLNP